MQSPSLERPEPRIPNPEAVRRSSAPYPPRCCDFRATKQRQERSDSRQDIHLLPPPGEAWRSNIVSRRKGEWCRQRWAIIPTLHRQTETHGFGGFSNPPSEICCCRMRSGKCWVSVREDITSMVVHAEQMRELVGSGIQTISPERVVVPCPGVLPS